MTAKGKADPPDRISPDDLGLFRAIFEQAAVGVAQIETATGRFLRVNQRYADIVGYAIPEVERIDFQTLTHPDDLAPDLHTLRRLMAGEIHAFTREKRYVHKDGHLVWVNLTVSPLWAPGEPPTSHLALVEDITRRKQSEEAMRTAKERMDVLLDSISDAFFTLDEQMVVTYYNAAAERLLGRSRKEVTGRPLLDAFPEARGSVFEQNYRAALATRQFMAFEVHFDVAPFVNWYDVRVYPWPEGIAVFFQVTTERKRDQETLQRSEEMFRRTFDLSPVGTVAVGLDLRFLRCNEAFCRFLGYAEAELLGRPYQDVTFPDDKEIGQAEIRALVAGALDRAQVRKRYLRKDGGVVWGEVSISLVRDPQGQPLFFLPIIQDVTERQRAEEAVRLSAQQLKSYIESAGDAIYVLEAAGGRIRDCNSRACLDLGYSRDELASLSATDIESRLRSGEVESVHHGLQPGEVRTIQGTHKRKDRTVFPVEIRLSSLAPAQPELLIAFARDITERKRMGDALRESQEKYQGLIETTDTGYVIVDNQGRVIDANREYVRLTGRERKEEIMGQSVLEWTAAHDRERNAAEVKKCVEQGFVRNLEIDYVTPAGPINPVELNGTVLGRGATLQILCLCRDITERKRAEETLRRKDELLAASQAIAHVGSWELELPAKRLTWSDEVYRIFGVEPPEFEASQEFFFTMVHPEDRAAVGEAYQRSLREGQAGFEIEHRLVCKRTGEIRHVHEKCMHVRDATGAVVRSIGMVQDITERKRAEVALRDSELRYRTLFEHSPDAIVVMDPETTLPIDFNDEACRQLGYTREEFARLRITDYEADQPTAEIQASVAECLAKGNAAFEVRHRTKQGDLRNTWVSVRTLETAGRKVFYSVWRDITDRKRAEQALRESEVHFRSLAETLPEAVFETDCDLNLTFANRRAFEVFGYGAEDLKRGMNGLEMLVPEDRNRARANMGMRLNGLDPGTSEYRALKKDGTEFPILFHASSIFKNGQLAGFLGIIVDITERKRAETDREKLQAQLTLAQRMESIGRLAGGVAHDFNNMLQAILGNASLALERLPADLRARENLEEIQKAAERSAELTRQLLAFARKQTIAPRVLDLNHTVAGMLKMLRRLIGEDIELAWMPGPNLWPVKVDPSQIDQILANLCVNARDAITGVGKVTIETDNVTLDANYAALHPDCLPGDYVMLAVSDNGTGMDAATQSHLFEPFFTTKGVGKGTGLGLATVFGLVKQNQGLINVYSEPGQGTTFKIYLPRAEAESVAPEPAVAGHSLDGTETVLVVEDEEQILSLSEMFLQQHGYTVLAASSPEAALTLAAQHPGTIHLLITDVVMPGMNGKALWELLQASHPGLKCLFMSGYTANVIANHGVLDEGLEFLQKPFTIQALAIKVREMLADGS